MPTITEQLTNLSDRISRFPAGKPVDVPAYLEDKGNPDAAEKWREMHEEHKDNFRNSSEGIMAETGDKAEYTAYFKKKMKEHGLEGIEGVDDAKLKKFYEDVDAGWKADKESSEQNISGRLASLAEQMRVVSRG